MFPVIVNDNKAIFPDDDIYYIVCKEGVYLKKRLGVMESISPVNNISILNSIQTMAKMHIRKIPAKAAQQIINFFKEVYKKHQSEAIVLLFYNQKTKKHKIICPVQEVSGGAATYNKKITLDGWDMIGTIHSHAGMSAFHSGVDDADEKTFDGLHITFGNMNDDDISISASIVANGFRTIVDPKDYINQLELTVDIDEEIQIPYAQTWKWDHKQHKLVEVKTGKFYTKRQFDQRYSVRLAKDPKFNPTWIENVSKKVYTQPQYSWNDGWYGHGSYYKNDYWKNWDGHSQQKVKNVVGGVTGIVTNASVVPPKPVDKAVAQNLGPCDACKFKNHKIDMTIESMDDATKKTILEWAIQQLDGKNYKDSLDTGLTHYHCMGCDEYISVNEEEGDACCPICKTDNYLVEVTESDIIRDGDGFDPDDIDDEDILGMIECNKCESSFTTDFLNDGCCPSCGNKIIDSKSVVIYKSEETDKNFIDCPDCGHQMPLTKLELDNRCDFCQFEFNSFDIQNIRKEKIINDRINSAESISGDDLMIDQLTKDAGAYMDADRETVNSYDDVERIPVPNQTTTPINKPGIITRFTNSIFGKGNK